MRRPPPSTLGVSVRGQDSEHHLRGPHEIVYGREIRGSGAYWHELPGDRDRPAFYGRTTLHSNEKQRPYLLLPRIPRG